MASSLLTLIAIAQLALSQQIGQVPEVHPILTSLSCSAEYGCKEKHTSVVLDATWRNLEDTKTGASCLTDTLQLNRTICSNAEECGTRCALQGADYPRTGVTTSASSNSVTLHMYQKYQGERIAVGPQIYLFDDTGKDYQILRLLNKEISFEVDASKLPCGMNGAMYLAEMNPSGGRSKLNPAGAAYGTGYCDSQCYTSYAFINGVANIHKKGTCCNEMDLWEANSRSTQMTPHPCNLTGFYACEGKECGDGKKGVCDKIGCGFNPYGLGRHDFYGLRSRVDTRTPFRVVTQFLTHDGTTDGTLVEIRRKFIQRGRTFANPTIKLSGKDYDSISGSYCESIDATSFSHHGGLDHIGDSLRRGMVLVMGIWNDGTDYLNWLDSGDAGPCSKTEGKPTLIKKKHPDTSVTFGDIRWGDIGTTC
jgi:cellulase